jgi:membrane protein implicated in regulation of membrane protease activity
MNFIIWLVFGSMIMFSEFATGTFYLLGIGLAFAYPAIASYADATTGMQLAVLGAGTVVHVLIVMSLRKDKSSTAASNGPDDVGQRVEVIEWLDEGSARVRLHGTEWEADKAAAEMPSATFGIIKAVQGSRLIITTE